MGDSRLGQMHSPPSKTYEFCLVKITLCLQERVTFLHLFIQVTHCAMLLFGWQYHGTQGEQRLKAFGGYAGLIVTVPLSCHHGSY